MESTTETRTVIDIGATTKQHADIACQLLAAHALTGCDTTVAFMWGIAKAKAVTVLSSGCKLLKIGNPDMAMDEVVQEATHFVARCYGCASSENMSSTRYEVWLGKTSKRKVTSIPKLKSLPPTSKAFEQNVKWAHYQGCIWKAALEKPLLAYYQQILAGKKIKLRNHCYQLLCLKELLLHLRMSSQ
ncbi:hypothetical protein GWK47_019289 [Chionoecetes opilio]|uniref:Uncharacterized protein n=1 Tax=Chionoecetes opilio TaxID=41210 RepID=A0A8J4XQW8_CHIOP|nr:hypothetical protein GWK47_019289 [Chionoecetes opilio]